MNTDANEPSAPLGVPTGAESGSAAGPPPPGAALRAARDSESAAVRSSAAVSRPGELPRPSERPPEPAAAGGHRGDLTPVVEELRRIERTLEELRGGLEAETRARGYREFSLGRPIGAILQTLAVLLVVGALADWVFQVHPIYQLVKIALAGVVQLGALTAFLLARERG